MRDQESTELPEVAAPVWQKIKSKLDRQRSILLNYFFMLTLIFLFSPDQFAAITVFPSWAWCVLGLCFMVRIPVKKWGSNLLFGLIAAIPVLMLTSEEFWSPFRGLSNSADRQGKTSQPWITSLNCAGGSADAAAEALATGAPIVLLQESPSSKELQKLADKAGYRVYWGIDGSVLTNLEQSEEFWETKVKKEQNFTLVTVNDVVIVSLRLQPPIFRLDLWNPECWTSQTQNLRSRKEELREIVQTVREVAKNVPSDHGPQIIMGGDYNAIPSQLRVKPYGFKDVGDKFGLGWIGTAVNDFPLARIDRIWVQGLEGEAAKLLVKKTVNSDHRMVVVYK